MSLTKDELEALDALSVASNLCLGIIGKGPTAEFDRREMTGHLHAIQAMVMSNCAARCYPEKFRLLGELVDPIVYHYCPDCRSGGSCVCPPS